jgi:Na+(H+)/acetate symporter ActP
MPFAGDPDGSEEERQAFDVSRRNFLALMFCLMVGTAGLPHLLTRFLHHTNGCTGANFGGMVACFSFPFFICLHQRWQYWSSLKS